MIKRALISVSDKTGIADFAKKLAEKGVEILSTGGTARLMRENGVEVMDVSDYTGFPEMMNGRVKTLHPKIHGGLLALRANTEHMEAAKTNDIDMIDLVVVNLYPFQATIEKEGVTLPEAIEQIDIGGPSMLRSAAKNFQSVTVITDPSDYEKVASELMTSGDTTPETRRRLAEKVFETTAAYDATIAEYLTEGKVKHIVTKKVADLRYGENPHQKAAFYKDSVSHGKASLVGAEQLQGKAMSYNNIMDADGALSIVREFSEPTVAFIKHANPCGIATANSIEEAYANAYEGDPRSAFGGIICLNRPVTKKIAEHIVSKFIEVVIAPSYDEECAEIFAKKVNLRILKVGEIAPDPDADTYRRVSDGLLVQDLDTARLTEVDLEVVSKRAPTEQEMKDLLFAWHTIKHVKSNAIVLVKNGMAVGIGAGQMSRIDALDIAIKRAMDREENSAMASDAFFPFPDCVETAAKHKITAIIHPGGSKNDQASIDAADKAGIAMVFTGKRAFLH